MMTTKPPRAVLNGKPIEGSIWTYQDELYIVEHVYGASQQTLDEQGSPSAAVPITLVKIRCIDPMPRHAELGKFFEHYRPYDPEE